MFDMKNWGAQIQSQLSNLSVSQKLLVGSLMIVMAMSLWLVVMYAGKPTMVPVLDQPLDDATQQRIVNYLDTRRIEYVLDGDRVMVTPDQRYVVIGALEENNMLPDDTSRGFAALAQDQSWWRSNAQSRQMLNIATQSALERVISAYPWVRKATVIVSRPQATGFGATHQRPTASVNIVMAGGTLNQGRVDAVAGLVSGAIAEMRPSNVTVIDAIAGRQWTVRPEGDQIPSDYLELVQKTETQYRTKITTALSYINKVIVAVSADVDLTAKAVNDVKFNKDGTVEALKSEKTTATESTRPTNGGEAGPRSNTGATIAGTGGSGSTQTSSESEIEFDPHVGKTETASRDPGGAPTQINATVGIPRSFFVALHKRGQPADAPEPTDEVLAPLIDSHTARIKAEVTALVGTTKTPGTVVVNVYPDTENPFGGDAVLATAGGGFMDFAGSDGMKTTFVGGLAVLAVFAMFMLLRSASKLPPIANARELAGIPPVLPSDEDLVGEAGEMNAALAGMEIDESQIRQQQIADQVGEMVRANPEQVAQIIGRWMKKDE